MFDIYDPTNDEERQRMLEELVGGSAPDMPAQAAPDLPAAPQSAPLAYQKPDFEALAPPSQSQPSAAPDDTSSSDGPSVFNRDTILSALLDLGMNRGRGVGQIVGATANNIEADRRAREQNAQRLKEIELRKNALDPRMLAIQQGNLDARNHELELAYKQLEARGNKQTNPLEQQKLQAEIDHLNREGQTKPVDEDMRQAELDLKRAEAERARRPAATGAEGMTAYQRSETERQKGIDQRAADKENRAAADQFTKETSYATGALANIDRIKAITDKYKEGELPGIGAVEGRVPDALLGLVGDYGSGDTAQWAKDAVEISNAKNTLGEMIQRKESGAAGPEAEKLRYLIRVGAKPGSSETEFRTGIDAARKLSEMEVRGFAVGKGNAARDVLKAKGINVALDDAAPAEPPSAATPQADDSEAAGIEQLKGQGLGNTGARSREIPKVTDVIDPEKKKRWQERFGVTFE